MKYRIVILLVAMMATATESASAQEIDVENIPKSAIDRLTGNPTVSAATAFDQVFGDGSAAAVLAQQEIPDPRESESTPSVPPPVGPFTFSAAERIVWVGDPKSGRVRACFVRSISSKPICSEWSAP